jgi:predicted CoA-substrate-specific enzyme activase
MRAAGLDIGSRTVKLVVVGDDREVVSTARVETTPAVAEDCRRLLDRVTFDRLVVTGYGRALAEVHFEATSVTEIKAFARGAKALHPEARTLLDVGGQDTKVVALDETGRAVRFEMNDKCAAGAGRFLELMAQALKIPVEQFGEAALAGTGSIRLSAMCAVFAESEVVGLVTRGVARADIARAVHESVASRAVAMVRRLGVDGPVLFGGGGARNPALVEMVSRGLGGPVRVPEDAQMVAARGAALIAAGLGPAT